MKPLYLLATTLCMASAFSFWPDTRVKTVGEVWPQPKKVFYDTTNFTFDPTKVNVVTSVECDILKSALSAFSKKANIVKSHSGPTKGSTINLNIALDDPLCPAEPQMGMVESYTLSTSSSGIQLSATQIWGLVRGLETLSQLIYSTKDGLMMRTATVSDAPRFMHRGLLLDTSRHFYPVKVIRGILELMAANKMNVFHWHITDNEAFPLRPAAYPELSKGAYSERHIYTTDDIKSIVAFARLRAIRVIPEIDTPGHAKAWGLGIPSIVNRCFSSAIAGREESDDRAMLDPTNDLTYEVLTAVFKELFALFPDRFAHLGGDEAEYWITQCWQNNANVTEYMKLWGMNSTKDLEQHYFDRLLAHLTARDMPKKNFMVWQEVLDAGIQMPQSIGHVWKGNNRTEQQAFVVKVIKAGHFAVLSSCWYLDHISWNIDWRDYYACEPQDVIALGATPLERERVIGGEAAMWGEMADSTNAIPRIFPRASAVAEKLWSAEKFTKQTTGDAVWPRLSEWICRMKERGFPVQPGYGPGFCDYEYEPALPDF